MKPTKPIDVERLILDVALLVVVALVLTLRVATWEQVFPAVSVIIGVIAGRHQRERATGDGSSSGDGGTKAPTSVGIASSVVGTLALFLIPTFLTRRVAMVTGAIAVLFILGPGCSVTAQRVPPPATVEDLFRSIDACGAALQAYDASKAAGVPTDPQAVADECCPLLQALPGAIDPELCPSSR